jgi:hypothetical protein
MLVNVRYCRNFISNTITLPCYQNVSTKTTPYSGGISPTNNPVQFEAVDLYVPEQCWRENDFDNDLVGILTILCCDNFSIFIHFFPGSSELKVHGEFFNDPWMLRQLTVDFYVTVQNLIHLSDNKISITKMFIIKIHIPFCPMACLKFTLNLGRVTKFCYLCHKSL